MDKQKMPRDQYVIEKHKSGKELIRLRQEIYGYKNENTAQSISLTTKVRRKLTTEKSRIWNLIYFFTNNIPLSQLLWLFCCLCMAYNSNADCPSVCECKWKSGKESVVCLNANLTRIPEPLDTGTQVLNLTGNDLVSIPHDTFAAVNLLNLQKIFLARCRLKVIERYAFRKLINLVELDLSYNYLSAIPSQSLEFIGELRELKLSGNPIYRIQNDAFRWVPQLVRLELTDCKLSMVDVRAFAALEVSLEWLKLDRNKLSEVRAGTITSLSNLHGIELAGNQWNCSCSLRPLRVWMLEKNIPCGEPPLCKAPLRLSGKTWDKIDLDEFACVPQIIATDTTAHGVEGRNVTMSCYVEGVPEPSVRWLVKNRVIANLTAGGETMASPRTAAATQGRKTYVVNMLRNASNLTILTADMQDAGIYTCAAENKAGKVEASVTLAVSRRPPDAPLGIKIVLLCILIALLFVVGSSFAAICFCSLRRKRKMRLWNSVPAARTDSYEKIEMTTRTCRNGNGNNGATNNGNNASGNAGNGMGGNLVGNCNEGILNSNLDKPDLGGGIGIGIGIGLGSGGITTKSYLHGDENGYLQTANTPLNCNSDDGGDIGMAIVNPSSCGSKRNGDYLNISTHCDDDGYDINEHKLSSLNNSKKSSTLSASGGGCGISLGTINGVGSSAANNSGRWLGNNLHTSPQDINKHKLSGSAMATSSSLSSGATAGGMPSSSLSMGNNATLLEDTDLHIPRLIDIGSTNESASSSISGQVDASSRLNAFKHPGNWTTTTIATTKIHSPHSHLNDFSNNINKPGNNYFNKDEVSKSVFCNNDTAEHEPFDSNYPDLLDIAKYAISQANNASVVAASSSASNGGLYTLPRKLKNTGKYFRNSSDSQSPLLADNSSKYGSSLLGETSFLNELALGRRFSAESSYSNYASTATYTTGQRSNSYMNLVQSAHKGTLNMSNNLAMNMAPLLPRRNPSLPSSPILDAQKTNQAQPPYASLLGSQQHNPQHQRSLSSAATPLLDFSALTTRATGVPSSVGMSSSLHVPTTTSSVTAYDYHAAQLERFLEEYRNLQDQLCKMKETCETIRKKEAPLRVGVGHSAALADPVMFNAAIATPSPTSNPRTGTLKTKTMLPGQPPDPPPYWLHRNALLKRLNDQQNDIFKS